MTPYPLSRRAFLRGVGVTMALPWLESEPSIAALHKNYSMVYSSHISWTSATTPTPLELYPALAFDRLFRDEVGRADKSVLDAVIEDAAGFRGKVSLADRRRLDEYL